MSFQPQRFSEVSSALDRNSSWIYLADWIMCLIVAIGFVFYFSRLVGFVFSHLLNLVLSKRYGVRINMQAFSISPLGGRVFAKNLTIITKDYTISVIRVNFTWRYWLFKLTRISAFHSDPQDPNAQESQSTGGIDNSKLPFRFLLSLDGLEVFMYNRTFAYDQILEALGVPDNRSTSTEGTSSKETKGENTLRFRHTNKSSSNCTSEDTINPEHKKETNNLDTKVTKDSSKSKPYIPRFLNLLPLKIRIKKGAIVFGNVSTPSIVVMSYKSADGAFDLTKSPDPRDNYRFWEDITFNMFQVWMKPNIRYDKFKYGNPDHAEEEEEHFDSRVAKISHVKRYKLWNKFQRSLKILSNLYYHGSRINKSESFEDNATQEWRGLRRYVGSHEDSKHQALVTNDEQYAKYTLIVDSVSTRIVYYYDSPGVVKVIEENGSVDAVTNAPEHGIDIVLSMATIHYGPWADHKRVPLQQALFPSLSRDSLPTDTKVEVGSLRQYAGFKVTTIVKDEVIFRIPTREKSKDKELVRSKNRSRPVNISNKVSRPFGWLEFKMNEGSTFTYFASYIADKVLGWDNRMNILLIEPEIRTSVNHDILFIADSHQVDARVGFPLKWDGTWEWSFEHVSENARIFFLREHTLLFSDIFGDFASGAPTPYEDFKPMILNVNWELQNYKLYLNVNDANIVNNPLDFNVNKYLSFQGESLSIDLNIPLYGEFAKSTTISYNISTSFFDLVLDTPPWHTAKTFMKDSNVVGRSNNFTIDGSYTFFSNIEIHTSDYIEIRCLGDYVTLKFYGFLIKYLFSIRENYFGDHIHFRTFEEFTSNTGNNSADTSSIGESFNTSSSTATEATDLPEKVKAPVDYWKIIKTENDVDILFTFQVRHGLIILPLNLYDCKSHIGLSFQSLDVDIRFTNYYMDLQADLTPIEGSFVRDGDIRLDPGNPNNNFKVAEIFYDIPQYKDRFLTKETPHLAIGGLTIHAHRMFGIPPEEITYFCKWDLEAEDIIIDSEALFVTSLVTGIKDFAFGYKDIANSLNIPEPRVYDAVNLSFRCENIQIKLSLVNSEDYVAIQLKSLIFNFNDMANERFSEKVSVYIPVIDVEIVRTKDPARGKSSPTVLGSLRTSLILTNIIQSTKMLDHRRFQQAHIKESDGPFHRSPFLLFPENRDSHYDDGYGCFMTNLTLPDVNRPLTDWERATYESNGDRDSFETQEGPTKDDSSDWKQSSEDPFYGEKFAPTQKYDPNEYCPSYEADPRYEYDNVIVELGDIQSFLTPCGLLTVAKFTKEFQDLSLDLLMDDLEFEVVKNLHSFFTSHYAIMNLRLVTQEISLKFGSFLVENAAQVFEKTQEIPYVNVLVIEASVAASFKKEKPERKKYNEILTDTTVAAHLKELLIAVTNPQSFNPPISLNIAEVEAWIQDPLEGNMVSSASVEEIELDLNKDQFHWLLEFAHDLEKQITPAIDEFSRPSVTMDEAYAKLVYCLTIASVDFSIDHDPEVLTKPANILRSSEDHVRFFDSWKIMSRLRHILFSLPEDWHATHNELLKTPEWKLPATAIEQITDIFSRWRSWEANASQRAFFFNYILFKNEQQRSSTQNQGKIVDIQLDIPEVLLKVSSGVIAEDFLSFQSIFVVTQISKESFNDGSTVGFEMLEAVNVFDIVANVESYKSRISTLSLDMIKEGLEFGERTKNSKYPSKANDDFASIKTLKSSVNLVGDSSTVPHEPLTPYRIKSNVYLPEPDGTPEQVQIHDSYKVSFVFNLDVLEQHFQLPSIKLELSAGSLTSVLETSLFGGLEDMLLFSSATRLSSLDLSVYGSGDILGSLNIVDFKLLGTNAGGIRDGSKIADLSVEKIQTKLLDKKGTLVEAISEALKRDVSYIEGLLPQSNSAEASSKMTTVSSTVGGGELMLQAIGDFALTINIQEFSWLVELLNPLRLSGVVYGNKLSVENLGGTIVVESFIKKVDLNVFLKNLPVLEIQNSEFMTSLKYNRHEDLNLLSLTSNTGYTKFFTPSITKGLEAFFENKGKLEMRLKDVEALANINPRPKQKVPKSKGTFSKNDILDHLAFKAKVSNDYVGISTFIEKTKYSFEVESVSVGVYNVTQENDEGVHSRVPLYGNFDVPTARFSVVDRKILIGLSNILDVNLSVRLLNSNDKSTDMQSLQVESQYCRVCLSSAVLIKMVTSFDHVFKCIPDLGELKPKAEIKHKPSKSSFSFLNKFSAVHLLAYNFCFGWLFENSPKNYPGVILGAERFFAITEEKVGKLTLMEAYLSVANGSRSSNFYSSSSEKSNLNRAFLPTMQLVYRVEKIDGAKNMNISITGDELDVKFLSNSIVIVGHGVNSVSTMQKFFKSRGPSHPVKKQESKEPEEPNEYINSFKSSFDSIELVATYAGSNVLFYRLTDDTSETPPSLFLHSPAVKIAASYKHQKHAKKKHVIKGEVLTTSSENVLYPSCIPVIYDIVEGAKEMMQRSENDDKEEDALESPVSERRPSITSSMSDRKSRRMDLERSESWMMQRQYSEASSISTIPGQLKNESETSKPRSKGIDFANVFSTIDIHFGLRIDKQALTLSCAPTAKVAAIVGLEGIYVQLNSGISEQIPSIMMAVLFDSVSASLQHVYSREISGSVSIKHVTMTSSLEFGEVSSVLSSGSFVDVSGYVNVKQFQDVELFKDIWFPKPYSQMYSGFSKPGRDSKAGGSIDITSGHHSDLASNKNISSRFKEVSTSYALPWVLTLIVSNIRIQVDFGQSLGNFKLIIGKMWAVSKKSTDWAQDLKMGIDSICLNSEGRLGGSFDVKNVNIHTAITWKFENGETLDVPLILLSGGVEKLMLKLSFDYHVFVIGNIEGFSVDVYNQKSEVSLYKDHLFVITRLDSVELYMTSLTASNCVDIYNTISRMIQENKRSYKETLRESSRGKSVIRNSIASKKKSSGLGGPDVMSPDILETVKKLEAKIEVIAGHVLIHVYPSSFDDSKVLVIKLDESRANFQQNEFSKGISNDLEIQFNDLKVSLSMTSTVSEDFISQCKVEEFVEYAHKAIGGSIFVFPSFKISMRTFQKYDDNVIEYLYQSSFGGTVDVRWNLGSVNFIREMYAIHSKALNSRIDYRRNSYDEMKLREDIFSTQGAKSGSLLKQDLDEKDEDPIDDIDTAINETFEKVSSSSKYQYSPIAPPIIEAPQLKELGNATPPLEWFGLHRNKFPNVTHQVGIVTLQKVMHEVESQYSKILGKA